MNERHFGSLLEQRWSSGTFVCVGLDTHVPNIPAAAQIKNEQKQIDVEKSMIYFNRKIIETTHDLVCAYKPNISFYEAHGDAGIRALRHTIQEIHHIDRNIPVILD